MIPANATITASDDVIFSAVDDKLVLLNTGNDMTYGLDAVASHVWERVKEQGATPESLLADILARYDVEEPIARNDLQVLLAHLAREGLVRVS